MSKTVSVKDMLDQANAALASDYSPTKYPITHKWMKWTKKSAPDMTKMYRLGICTMIESVLHASGNYAGFTYLDSPFVDGVTDESRRRYIMHKNLTK